MLNKTINEKLEEMEQEYDEETLEHITKKSKWIFVIWSFVNIFYCASIVMLGYNWIIPKITNLQPITYIQALFLDWFITFLFKFSFDYNLFNEKESSFIKILSKKLYLTTYYTIILLVLFIIQLFI